MCFIIGMSLEAFGIDTFTAKFWAWYIPLVIITILFGEVFFKGE